MLKTCPSPDQLHRLLTDQLGEAQETSIGDHIEKCPHCQESLERMTQASDKPGSGEWPIAEGTAEPPRDEVDTCFLHDLKSDPPSSVLISELTKSLASISAHEAPVEHSGSRLAPAGYELLGELGRGGTGIVYRARQHRLGRLVALKMALAGAYATPRELDRFNREAEAIARLQHPNIVQIYEVGEHEGRPYLALEYVDGESLARAIDGNPQSARGSAELVERIARAIHAAHELGVIHRDLKPANVLLTRAGVPKITDFGIAKQLDGETAYPTLTEQFLGTPSYTAPEQAVRKRGSATPSARKETEISAAVDVFSLGAILYELLTGRTAFRGETPLETVLQVLNEDPVPPTRLRPSVPRDLETICLKCLEKAPQRRYASALALAEDLHRFLNLEPVRARPISAPERIWRWCRRRTSLAIAVGLAAIAFMATIGLSVSLAVYHYRAASRISEAFDEVRSRQRLVDQQASNLAYEHGQALCEQGDVGQGMLWLVRALKSASRAHDGDLIRALRLNIAGWWPRLHLIRVRCETPSPIHAAVYSPDGRTIALGGEDRTVRFRDATTGLPTGAPIVHPEKVGAVAFSPDGRLLLTGSDDGIGRLWDPETGALAGPQIHHAKPILGVAFSPDGRTLLTGGFDKTARLWNAEDGKPLGQPMIHGDLITSVAFSPDGRTVLTGSWDKTARLWDAKTGSPIGEPLLHRDWVSSVAYSPDSRAVITGCYDRTARIWETETGRPIGRPLRHQHCVHAVAFGPDGKMIVTGSFDGIARLWDAETGVPIGPTLRHQHTVSSVAFAPDGRTVLTAGFDKTALIYEVAKTSGLSFSHDGFIRAVLFSPDGRTILTASVDHTAKLWNAATGEPVGVPLTHADAVEAIAFSPDGQTVLTGSSDHTARLWDARTGQPLGPPLQHEDRVKSVAFSAKGDLVLTGSAGDNDKSARLWDAKTSKPIGPPLRHEGWVQTVAFSPDGRSFVTGSVDKTARLWNTSDRRLLTAPLQHDGRVEVVAFSPDGQTIITGSDDMKARLWNVGTGKLRLPPLQHDGPVTVAAFSADGRTVITGGWDRVARLWDAEKGLSITPPLRHEGLLRALAISPDGHTVLTGSYDRSAQLWDKVTGKPIGPAFRHENQVWFVVFSPDGRTVLSGGQENQAHLWNVPAIIDSPIKSIERSIQIATGMELLDDGSIHILDFLEWNARRDWSN